MRNEIVVGVDGSDASVAALRRAIGYAEHDGGTVHVTSVWSPGSWDTSARTTADAAALVRSTVERAGPSAAPITASIVEGSPGATLVRLSADARLLVVGARGVSETGMLPTTWIGTVARYLTRHAGCPVTVVADRPVTPVADRSEYVEEPIELPGLACAAR